MKTSEKLEPVVAHTVLGVLAIYLLAIYDTWEPSRDFPSSWKAGALEALLTYVHRPGLGTVLGKGFLTLITLYCIRKIYLTIKS